MEKLFERLEALKTIIEDEATAKRISQVAAIAVIADYQQRIFDDGLASDNTPIGQYSVNPFYINPNSDALAGVASSSIKPVGKTGQTVFKNGKPHKTKYLTRGYAELRENTGRQSAKVDLNFSGSLFISIKVKEVGNVSFVSYTNEELAGIMAAQERRFMKEISTPTEQEREVGLEAARDEFLAILEEIDGI
jgi:hypothetical protein